jgi:glycosyltransferase involved in cell wall biosynthesis
VAGLRKDEFWLHVGTDEPRKNIDTLLQAYASVRRDAPRILPLVLAGASGWHPRKLQDRIDALGLSENVRALDYVRESHLRWLYENCFAFVFPSHFEGFGMPVLEAMELGAAVIASRQTSIPEIAGDCAILVDSDDTASLSSAMRTLLSDPKRKADLGAAALQRSKIFSWSKAARETLDVYRQALARPKRARPRSLRPGA